MIASPKEILKKYWGYGSFKGSQEKIISGILNNQDVLALMPTGGGKSISFQIPALLKDGICIVVSPLIALIQNQVDTLRNKGIKVVAMSGSIPTDEIVSLFDNCMYGNYKFLYISPERLQQQLVQERIQKLNVNLIAIDEAHCISQWGHDFRPAYLECKALRKILPDVPIVALTATATKQVEVDIIDNLQFAQPLIIKDSFSRNNIAFKVYNEEDKRYRLKKLCATVTTSGIVYVRTRRLTQEIAQLLNSSGNSATFFHGGLPKKEKETKLNHWLQNKVKIMVATNAFGMGIDKPDVELVVHYQIPDCIENYYQEAGRAGRNGKHAQAVLIRNNNDEHLLRNQFLSVLPDSKFIKLVYNKLNNYFQIAYGEGNGLIEPLNFNAFCATYKLNYRITYNTLQILDRNSVIVLNESFSKHSTIQFLANKEQLFNYFDNNRNLAQISRSILRTYGGVFDFETKINIHLISKKENVSEAKVAQTLKQLESDGIISYTAMHSDLEITFLVPREDDLTINKFAKEVKERKQIKIDNLEHMLHYLNTNTVCRSKQLLDYFGEPVQNDCGICDVCLSSQNSTKNNLPFISKEILNTLNIKSQTSRRLVDTLSFKEAVILQSLQLLLEDNKIRINAKNEYEIE